ncbi:MAG TPA: hypothetical protein VNE38_09860 [Ktedonobacteraceae bacterium]|nr:hypothetical protein [Ktedonobacteraceae bacterium]
MEYLTVRQAFDAMVQFLEGWYQLTHSEGVGNLLSGLDLAWRDPATGERWTADPALWDDWMRSVQKVLFPDTPENHQRLETLITEQQNYLGKDSWGNDWYARLLPDGKQLWACVRSGMVQYGGMRNTPKSFDPRVGFSSPGSP